MMGDVRLPVAQAFTLLSRFSETDDRASVYREVVALSSLLRLVAGAGSKCSGGR